MRSFMPSITSNQVSVGRTRSSGGTAAALRTLAVAAGICCSVLFVVLGLHYELQLYADGSIFSYSIAVQDAWAFHWHSIIGRVFVYLCAYAPTELYLEITRDARAAIDVYGFLFFV